MQVAVTAENSWGLRVPRCTPHLSEKATKAFKGGEICFESNRDLSRLAVCPENEAEGQAPAQEFGGLCGTAKRVSKSGE